MRITIKTVDTMALSRKPAFSTRFRHRHGSRKAHSAAEVLGRSFQEIAQQLCRSLRRRLGKEMTAFDGLSADVVGPLAPQRERAFRIPVVERPVRAPQRQYRACDFVAG